MSANLRCPRYCACEGARRHRCLLSEHLNGPCAFIPSCATRAPAVRPTDARRTAVLDHLRAHGRAYYTAELARDLSRPVTTVWRDLLALADAGVVRLRRDPRNLPDRSGGVPLLMAEAVPFGDPAVAVVTPPVPA